MQNDEFLAQVKSALDHLYEYRYLDEHPLARLYTPTGSPNAAFRAERFNRLVLESIDDLNPPEAPCVDSLRMRAYRLLVHRYVEEWPLPEIMRELGLSRTQFFREQRKAIAVLARFLRQRLPGDGLVAPEAPVQEKGLHVEAKRLLQRREVIDLTGVLEDVLKVLRNLADQQGVTIAVAATPELPQLYHNRTLVRQVFVEVLSAFIAQPETPRISVALSASEVHVEVALTATRAPNAAPMGEALTEALEPIERLVGILGGTWLGVRSVNGGPRCRFRLPVEEQAALLVIDDNEGMIRVFRSLLEGRGYKVVGCTRGVEALQAAKAVHPAAITLDIMMPNHDGWEILQALRSDPELADVPVIVCSVLEDPKLAYSLGATAYLHKPITQAALLATLDAVFDPQT
jgi:CheY-like chemotaxis protein